MIRKHNITATLALAALLTACSSEETSPTFTVGEADNAIVLRAGITEGGAGVATRAAEDHHTTPGHLNFISGTGLALQVSGTWAGKNAENKVTQTTTGTTGDVTGANNLHNEVSMNPQLYWDDYGTADPANAETGRVQGLTIYGAAVNGEDAPTVANFTALSWTLNNDQSTNWAKKDLLISNNVKAGADGCYKFDDKADGKLLEFTHAMSKVTINLIADEGFPTTGVGNTTNKFQTTPDVYLTRNENGGSLAEWAYTTGTVNVTDGTISSQATPEVITTKTNRTSDATYTVVKDALIMPGSCFGTADTDIIAKINADGNIYYVTAKEIRKAITSTLGSGNEKDFKAQSGYNYILKIKVKKTKIEVTATITDWIDVTADEVTPLINVTTAVGTKGASSTAFDEFAFYLKEDGTTDNYAAAGGKATGTPDGTTNWSFQQQLYWPTHSTHYHMRGVYPYATTVTDNKIAVANCLYNASSAPSNLLVGAPEIATNTLCDNADHTSVDMSEHGICAREASINLNFRYMMSQVEVRLTTNTGAADAVNLVNAKVDIVNGYTTGDVDIHTRSIVNPGTITDFTIGHVTDEDANYRHSTIVPQALTNTNDLKFKVTIYKSGSTTEVDDIYYATIKDIQVTENGTKKSITKWDSGKHYVYTLNLKKTEIKVTATITDWITVTASDNVWF
ncbi:MAG: fimbrillin family protein [Bacteroidales bacterium]|nr:fimbrillin family protein [Bacteroidales bacterium]